MQESVRRIIEAEESRMGKISNILVDELILGVMFFKQAVKLFHSLALWTGVFTHFFFKVKYVEARLNVEEIQQAAFTTWNTIIALLAHISPAVVVILVILSSGSNKSAPDKGKTSF